MFGGLSVQFWLLAFVLSSNVLLSTEQKDSGSGTTAVSSVLRLVGGKWEGEGRVEIFYNGSWGTVCDDHWDIKDAQVVCRELNYSTATSAPKNSLFGHGNGPIWLDEVECLGNETSIMNCHFKGWGKSNCDHREDASVNCSADPIDSNDPIEATAQPSTGETNTEKRVFIATPNVTYAVGDKVDLKCKTLKADMSTTVQWIRHGTVLKSETIPDGFGSQQYYSFYYKIHQVSLDQAGMYTCQAILRNSTFSLYLNDSYNLKVREFSTKTSGQGKSSNNTALLVSVSVLSAILCLTTGVCLIYKRRIAAQRNGALRGVAENLEIGGDDLDTRYLSVSTTCWEIASKKIDLQNVLGSGSFGEVWKAVVSGLKGIPGETTVAVKKLKRNCSDTEKESLAQEIELGKSLNGDRHPNIVNFLGCVSTSVPMMLILEYVPHGDLLGYLRHSRGVEDKYYSCPENCQEEVTSYDLLSFAQQIASGMSFLASKKILHRDLAARNVLVGVSRICKIADFGLALIRDKYQYLYCTAIRKGRLPIKWTAPEHLFNDSQDKDVRVSEKSDVWSYGVVLYEIFTLGGVPYPGWNEWKVVFELKINKYRMGQPEHVSDDLYQIMLHCWNENPNDRPTFERLYEMTTEFLQEEHYVDLDLSKYEPSLYTNVEEIAAEMSHAVSLEAGNTQPENDTTVDSSKPPNKEGRL